MSGGTCEALVFFTRVCGRRATLIMGVAMSCDCYPRTPRYSCDEHVSRALNTKWECDKCGAPAQFTEPVRL